MSSPFIILLVFGVTFTFIFLLERIIFPKQLKSQDELSLPEEVADSLMFFDFTTLPSLKELSKKYHFLAKKCHPDTGGNSASFNELKKHYEIIKNYIDNS